MPKSIFSRGKTLLRLSLGLLLIPVLLLAGALLVLDDEDYRDALIWAAERYLDARLEINGPFSFELGSELSLTAERFNLLAKDEQFSLSVEELATRLRLMPLLSGTIWLDQLVLNDTKLTIDASKQRTVSTSWGGAAVPRFILEEARIQGLLVAYEPSDDAVAHTLEINELYVDDVRNAGPISLRGSGSFNHQRIDFDGKLGSYTQAIDDSAPYPLEVVLRSGTLALDLSGTIADPIKGKGLDLLLRADDSDLAATISLLAGQVPPLGTMSLEARIGGDYATVRLDQVTGTFGQGDDLNIKVDGRVADAWTGDGMNLRISGLINDPAVWKWMTQGELADIRKGTLKGVVTRQAGAFRLNTLSCELRSKAGITVNLKGAVNIDPRSFTSGKLGADLVVSLSSPTTAALQEIGIGELPKLGPIKMSTHLFGDLPVLGFDTFAASVGRNNHHWLVFENGSGQIDLKETAALRKASFTFRASTPRPEALSRLFEIDIPAMDRTEVEGTLKVNGKRLLLENFNSWVGPPRKPIHKLSGTVVHKMDAGTAAELFLDLDADRLLAQLSDLSPGDLGRVSGRLSAARERASWQINKLQLDSKGTDLFQLGITAHKGRKEPGGQGHMDLRLRADDPPRLFKALGLGPTPIAPLYVEGRLINDQGPWRYHGGLQAGESNANVNLTATFSGDRPQLTGDIRIPKLTLSDIGLSVEKAPATESPQVNSAKATPKKSSKRTGNASTERRSDELFGRQPLDLTWLQALDLDVSVLVEKLHGVDFKIDRMKGKVILRDGLLRISPADFYYSGGAARGSYEIRSRGIPKVSARMAINDLALGDLLEELLPDTIQGGILDVELKLDSQGHSLHQWMSNLNGEVDLAFEKAKIPSVYIETLSADVFGWTLGEATLSASDSPLDCAVIGLDIERGIGESHILLADGPNLTMTGRVLLDLNAETIDLVVLPKQKKGLFANATPVKVSGKLGDPHIEVIPAEAATIRIGKMVLLPQVFVPLEALISGWRFLDKSRASPGCSKILGRSVEDQFAFHTATPERASQD